MSALRLSRRGLFGGFAALLAAPAIVRVASIMPVVAVPKPLTFAEMVAAALRDHPDDINELVSANNALAASLRAKGIIRVTAERSFFVSYA